MKIARIFRHSDGLIYVCDDTAGSLDATGRGCVSKADAARHARALGYTHAVGSGTYAGNQLTDLGTGSGFSLGKFRADLRRRKNAREIHTQQDLDGLRE